MTTVCVEEPLAFTRLIICIFLLGTSGGGLLELKGDLVSYRTGFFNCDGVGGDFFLSTTTSDVGLDGMGGGSFDLKAAVVLGTGGGILGNLVGEGGAGLRED